MSRYLLDTDWIVDVLHDQPLAINTLAGLAHDGLAVSLISYGELWEGASFSRDPELAHERLEMLLQGKQLLGLTESIVQRFGDLRGLLRQTGQIIGDLDLLIAATALEYNLVLITRNTRHFQRIPDLMLYTD